METNSFDSVVEHIEGHLGEISVGWSDVTSSHGIRVVSFKNQPSSGVITYVTLGLSENELALPRNRKIRQEIVMSAYESFSGQSVASFLLSLAERIKLGGRAVLRGEVVGPGHPLVNNATVNSVYVTNPTPFEDSFSEFSKVDPPVIFALLVPITEGEVSLITNKGWNWFEDMLESQDPDIWDLNRVEQITLDNPGV